MEGEGGVTEGNERDAGCGGGVWGWGADGGVALEHVTMKPGAIRV